jgi:D-alanyl-D-alanine carboxypeptidase
MDGIKTGYTNASGFNLVGTAVRGNTRLLGVVLGQRSAVARNAKMTALLDAGFRRASKGKSGVASWKPKPRDTRG